MKKIFMLMLAAACMLTAGCGKPDGPNKAANAEVAGEWKLTMWSNAPAGQSIVVWLALNGNGKFDLYQKIWTTSVEHYTGTYSANKGTLTGRYSDGQPWASEYAFSLNAAGDTLTLTRTDNPADVSVYAKGQIPEEVISGDINMMSVPAGAATVAPAAVGPAEEGARFL